MGAPTGSLPLCSSGWVSYTCTPFPAFGGVAPTSQHGWVGGPGHGVSSINTPRGCCCSAEHAWSPGIFLVCRSPGPFTPHSVRPPASAPPQRAVSLVSLGPLHPRQWFINLISQPIPVCPGLRTAAEEGGPSPVTWKLPPQDRRAPEPWDWGTSPRGGEKHPIRERPLGSIPDLLTAAGPSMSSVLSQNSSKDSSFLLRKQLVEAKAGQNHTSHECPQRWQ